MSTLLSWKEKARMSCSQKGLYSLSDSEKNELCDKGFESLSKINNIDKTKAEEKLKSLRGK